MPSLISSATPPSLPAVGDEWQNTSNNRRYVWSGTAWMQRSAQPAPPPSPTSPPTVTPRAVTNAPSITNPDPKHTMSDVPPSVAVPGDFWWDTTRGFLFTWYDDGNTVQWVVSNPGQGGAEGPPGQTGDKGDTGDTGPPGPQGPQGIHGADSTVPGPPGATGPQGIQGVQGPQGAAGATGATGAAGAKGDKGDPGATGATGPQGPIGNTGAAGPPGAASTVPGPQGPKGDPGATGATGAQGPIGNTGAQGPIGNTGAAGPTGPAGTTLFGTTPPPSPNPGQLWYYTDASTGGGSLYIWYNDGNSSQWVPAVVQPAASANPPGMISDYAGASAPTGWLMCNGQLVSRTAFANLFAVIGTLYGAGDGSTTFAVPDLGGRVTAGKEATATRLTTAGAGIDGATLGAFGGVQTYALAVGDLASHQHAGVDHLHTMGDHTHGMADHNHQGAGGNQSVAYCNWGSFLWGTLGGPGNGVYGYGGVGLMDAARNVAYMSQTSGWVATAGADRSLTSGATGSGAAHQNTQPTMIMNKIIKT